MGVRALIENLMTRTAGDHGNFTNNLAALAEAGSVSAIECKRLRVVLDVGHAAMHRGHVRSRNDLTIVLGMAEGRASITTDRADRGWGR